MTITLTSRSGSIYGHITPTHQSSEMTPPPGFEHKYVTATSMTREYLEHNPRKMTHYICKFGKTGQWQKLHSFCIKYFELFNMIHVSAALKQFTLSSYSESPAAFKCWGYVHHNLQKSANRQLSNLLCILAKTENSKMIQQISPRIYQELIHRAPKDLPTQELTSILVSYLKILRLEGVKCPQLVKWILKELNTRRESLDSQNLYNLCNSLNDLGSEFHDAYLETLQDCIKKRSTFNHVELVELCLLIRRSKASLEIYLPLFSELERKVDTLNQFSRRKLLKFLRWPDISKLKGVPGLKQALECEIRTRSTVALHAQIEKLKGLAELGQISTKFLIEVCTEIKSEPGQLTWKMALNLLGALRSVKKSAFHQRVDFQVVKLCCDCIEPMLYRLSAEQLGSLFRDLSSLSFTPKTLFRDSKVIRSCVFNEQNSSDFASLLFSYAGGIFQSWKIDNIVLEAAEKHLSYDLSIYDLIRIAWALATMNKPVPSLQLLKALRALKSETLEEVEDSRMAHALHIALVALKIRTGGKFHRDDLCKILTKKWSQEDRELHESRFQKEVSQAVCKFFPDEKVINELAIEDGLFYVDIAVPSQKLIIEADGVGHYSWNNLSRRKRSDLLKDYILQHLGWTVVRVPMRSWPRNNPQAQHAFLQSVTYQPKLFGATATIRS